MGELRSVLIEDAAVLMGVSRRTVYYRIKDGRLRTIRTRGGSQRVLLTSIVYLLQSGRLKEPDSLVAPSEAQTAPLQIEPLP